MSTDIYVSYSLHVDLCSGDPMTQNDEYLIQGNLQSAILAGQQPNRKVGSAVWYDPSTTLGTACAESLSQSPSRGVRIHARSEQGSGRCSCGAGSGSTCLHTVLHYRVGHGPNKLRRIGITGTLEATILLIKKTGGYEAQISRLGEYVGILCPGCVDYGSGPPGLDPPRNP